MYIHIHIYVWIYTYIIRISIHTPVSAATNSHQDRELLDSQQRMTMNDPDMREFVCSLALLQGV